MSCSSVLCEHHPRPLSGVDVKIGQYVSSLLQFLQLRHASHSSSIGWHACIPPGKQRWHLVRVSRGKSSQASQSIQYRDFCYVYMKECHVGHAQYKGVRWPGQRRDASWEYCDSLKIQVCLPLLCYVR